VQNWYKNIYNLVTKRAWVEEKGEMRWIDGNLGSALTMKYPSCVLAGEGATGSMLSIAWAGADQHQDTGAKMIHLAPNTTSQIISKSISKNGGRATYRGLVQINKGAVGARSKVVCDALILDDLSRSDTYPVNKIFEEDVILEHEAVVSRVSEEQLLYLMSRGLPEHEAEAMVVNGFLEPVMKEVPMEYAVEMNRLVELEMEGSVG
jgi:Fe-S cluster assembly protein SufB